MFPAWLTVVSRTNPHRGVQLAVRLLDVHPEGKADAEIVAEGIRRLRVYWHDVLHLPANLKELGVEHPDIEALVRNLHRTKGERFGNYVKLDAQLTRDIYMECCK